MGVKTGISWTDHTFNPWWGCEKVSPGCTFCYAERDAHRYGHEVWGLKSPRRFFGDKHWNDPMRWDKAAAKDGVRRRVFCASMADVFEARMDLDPWRAKLWDLIDSTPNLDWLLLTKRPENVMGMVPWTRWPNDNVWMGVTAEDQKHADLRIPILLKLPAKVRWVSYEPALGLVDFTRIGANAVNRNALTGRLEGPGGSVLMRDGLPALDWIIVGGESGHAARPFSVEWARYTINQCRDAGVACFVKQMGDNVADGRRFTGKGGDPAEWPPDLRVQEFPACR